MHALYWMNNGGEVSKYKTLHVLIVIYVAARQLFDKIPQRIHLLDFLVNLFIFLIWSHLNVQRILKVLVYSLIFLFNLYCLTRRRWYISIFFFPFSFFLCFYIWFKCYIFYFSFIYGVSCIILYGNSWKIGVL